MRERCIRFELAFAATQQPQENVKSKVSADGDPAVASNSGPRSHVTAREPRVAMRRLSRPPASPEQLQAAARQMTRARRLRRSRAPALCFLVCLACDFREIRDGAGRRSDTRKKCKAVGTYGQILIVHENFLEE